MKSGWAAAVLLAGSSASPRVVDSRRIDLSDPAIPDSRQPYHAGFGTAREAGPGLSQLISGVKRFGRQSVLAAIRHYESLGFAVRGAAIVAGSLADPARITNPHIRIHALEGQLFRGVVQEAVNARQLPCAVWRGRDLADLQAGVLEHSERSLRDALTALGCDIDGAWRAEQKAAALAAWLVLARRR